VGAVTATTARVAEANINITAAAATGAGAGRYGMILWVAATDYERAADALGARARRMAPRSQMERLLYLDQNYLSGIVKRKVAFRELEPSPEGCRRAGRGRRPGVGGASARVG
jgi:hypothetical protein